MNHFQSRWLIPYLFAFFQRKAQLSQKRMLLRSNCQLIFSWAPPAPEETHAFYLERHFQQYLLSTFTSTSLKAKVSVDFCAVLLLSITAPQRQVTFPPGLGRRRLRGGPIFYDLCWCSVRCSSQATCFVCSLSNLPVCHLEKSNIYYTFDACLQEYQLSTPTVVQSVFNGMVDICMCIKWTLSCYVLLLDCYSILS